MMVIAQWHALRGAPFGKRGQFAPIFFDLCLIQLQFTGKRCRLIALDCTRGFTINNTGCPHGFEQLKLRGNPVFLGFDLAAQQKPREPTPADRNPVALKNGAQNRRVHWKTPPGFHAAIAGFAGLAQAFFQRNIIAELFQIIIPPSNRGDAKLCFHLLILRYVVWRGSHHGLCALH